MYFFTTHNLNLRIKSENKKNELLHKRNCPHEIDMYFYTTHWLNLRIGLKNRKTRESGYSKKLSTWNEHVLLYNSHSKFENWIEEQKKKREWLHKRNCPHEINMYFDTTHQLNLRIRSKNRKRRESGYSLKTFHMK